MVIVVITRTILVRTKKVPWKGLRVEYIAFFVAFLISATAKLALDIAIIVRIGSLLPQSMAFLVLLVDSPFIGVLGGLVWIRALKWFGLAPKGQPILQP